VPGSGWDALPAECKLLIFEQLSNRELARAARTCREFAAHIRGLRASLTSIVLPRGANDARVLSASAMSGSACGVRIMPKDLV